MTYPDIDNAPLVELLRTCYGLSGEISRLAGTGNNFLVTAPDGSFFVLKLCGEDQTTAFLQLENLATEAAAVALPDLTFPRTILTREGKVEAQLETGNTLLRGRLLHYVEGTPWGEADPATNQQRQDFGRLTARLAAALTTIDHPAAHNTHRWDLTAAAALRPNIALVDDPARRRVLEQAFLLYSANARPYLDQLPYTLIHNDLNDENVLVANGRIVGVLDFGDCLTNPVVCDLAIGLAYMLLDEPDPLAAGAEIVAAYHAQRPLSALELGLLFPLICGRLAVSLSIAAERHLIDPGRTAWFVTEDRAWQVLQKFVQLDPMTAADALANGTGVEVYADRSQSYDEVLPRRRQFVSNALSMSFSQPLKIARGRGQFLFDERDRPYLDLYNNVCHVGHCHPHVVDAGYRQMQRLNTNSRYLYDQMSEYAARLCATLPAPLEVCILLNSGTEANELALRLARAATGHKDMLVVDVAYHGHTTTMIDISPYKFMGKGGSGYAEDWVHVVDIPDGYRGRYRGQGREAGEAYGNDIGQLIAGLNSPFAGFITESLPSVGGQIIPPEGYLETAFAHVRRAGGVCIADEVQVGFGRVGTHFWGFERQNVIPDIVVMGKPIGNGHPMAAVVTTRAIADSFAGKGMEFFSTFGGNPVSCAIGTAVLDVIRDENLQENAHRVGTHLRDRLRALMDRHPLIGDVRGVGLFIGLELVRDRNTLEPAAEEAALLVDELRRHSILTGTDGPYHNVVKIKPPMVVTIADADMAIRTVDDILTHMNRQ